MLYLQRCAQIILQFTKIEGVLQNMLDEIVKIEKHFWIKINIEKIKVVKI